MEPPTTKGAHRSSRIISLEIYQYEEPPIYGDTTYNINKNMRLSWYNIYEEFVKLNIPETQEDFPMYLNIKRYKLHKIVSHPPIFPCVETTNWIIQSTNIDSWVVRDHICTPLETISSTNIATYYRLPENQETFNTWWLSNFAMPTRDILREWWQDPSKFRVRTDEVYRTKGLRNVYQLISAMMCHLYGKADCDIFHDTWVPLMYVVTTGGTMFNRARILVLALRTNIIAAKYPEPEQQPEFYMSSYLLDVFCARCQFNNWDTLATSPMHHHYKVFWDSTYKVMIDVISESFIAPLYQRLFGEEPSCMLKRSMETIVKVAHWFPI